MQFSHDPPSKMKGGDLSASEIWISPYWNVNQKVEYAAATGLTIWISPYWNVNKKGKQKLKTNYIFEYHHIGM